MNAYVEPIVHNSPDKWDALAFICVGIAICAIIKALIWVLRKGEAYADASADRAAARAEHVATKTKTWVAAWAGRSADVAEVEAAIARGDYLVRGWWHVPTPVARLSEHRRKHGRRAA